MIEALTVRAQVIGCRNCGLVDKCTRPVPFDGPFPSEVAVVGEAPGRVEDATGKPFVGPSGELARSIVEPRLGQVPWLNVVSCWPNRTPTAAEVEACKGNLHAQLRLIEPRLLLLFGGVAASAWVSDLRVGELRGRWFKTDIMGLDRTIYGMVTWHPAAVLRNRNLLVDVLDDLRTFRESVGTDGIPPYVYYPCVKCGSCVDPHVTDEGLSWCRKHWDWKQGRSGKGRTKRQRLDGRLFDE
jgi:DNA polymerase